jgi:hypothetical protein
MITELDLYAMSKETLIKKIQILLHELKVYYRVEEEQNLSSSKSKD